MDTGWLYDFLALIETGSFTQAAAYRNCSQAAFSRRIQNLENWVGDKLVDRSVYPMKLTAAGEKFHHKTLSLTAALEEARGDAGQGELYQQVRVALTYSLAADRFPHWWARWVSGADIRCATLVGNVLETTSLFTAGQADFLISYWHPLYPGSELDQTLYDKVVISRVVLRPYANRVVRLPGTSKQPVPLLHYTEPSYFAKVVRHIWDTANQPLHHQVIMTSEMTATLARAAQHGLGVAWLTDSHVKHLAGPALIPVDQLPEGLEHDGIASSPWCESLDVVVHKAYANRRQPVQQIWQAMKAVAV